jgi:hypothetical protein
VSLNHIFIGGTSFTGSTLMGLILGSVPGVANVGESNWLVPRLGHADASPNLWDDYDRMQHCRLCGQDCRIWTKDFRMALQCDPTCWFERIAGRLQTHILVSSEKEMPLLEAVETDQRHTALILFREPAQFWVSMRKREWRRDTIQQTMRRWARTYRGFLKDSYRPQGGKLYMNIDAFQARPEQRLALLLGRLDLKDGRGALQYWENHQHYIGGNFNVYQKLKNEGSGSLVVRSPPIVSLSSGEKNFIRDHEAYGIYREMLTLTPGLSESVTAASLV